MNSNQMKLIRQALGCYTQSKRKTARFYKKELEKGGDGVGAETRWMHRMAEAGEKLSLAIRKAIR